jgi:hypothetical protein
MDDLRDDIALPKKTKVKTRMRLRILILAVVAAVALGLTAAVLSHPGAAAAAAKTASPTGHQRAALTTTSTTNTADTSLPLIKHVFVIVLENESAATTFPASGTAPAPFLADTMVSQGALLPNYYGTGHNSNDNYISMISGQAPNLENSEDCVGFSNFPSDATTGAPYNEQEGLGCVYPSDIPNIASQLDAAGDSWKDYNEDMGNIPTRESAECGHPAIGARDETQSEVNGDAYATRHDPFVYFHNIIDDPTLCDTHVVNLNALSTDLQSASTTPNYVFITPNLCHDGHDATCSTPGENGGFKGINDFLSAWIPKIEASPAYQQQNGLIITTFDEAATSDTSDCCGEQPGPGEAEPGLTGKGGGRVGAVLISPCIAPGTVSDVAYNHYGMLGSVENIFGLSHIGYAALPGQSYFGSDVFTGSCSTPPDLTVSLKNLQPASTGVSAKIPLSFSSAQTGVTYNLQVRQMEGAGATAWKTLEAAGTTPSYSYTGHTNATYEFRVQATNGIGLSSAFQTETVTVPTAAAPPAAKLKGHWKYVADAGAWRGHAESGTAGSSYHYAYTGGALSLLATKLPAGARVKVTFDGRSRVVSLKASSHRAFQTIPIAAAARPGHHSVTLTVLSGTALIEGLVVSDPS